MKGDEDILNVIHFEKAVGYMFIFIGIFFFLDFVTGVYKGFKGKKLESKKMKKGLLNFCGITLVMIIAEVAGLFVDLFNVVPRPQLWSCGAVTFYFILMEIVSILENLREAGFKHLPKRLVKYLKTKDQGEIGDDVLDLFLKNGKKIGNSNEE